MIDSSTDKTILLVEDNPINQKLAQKTLAILGCQVTTVVNGEQALLAYKKWAENFSLILMDGEMPRLNGFDTTEAIRKWEQQQSGLAVPIIAWTANYVEGDNQQKWLSAGVNGFLAKPFGIEEMKGILAKWLADNPLLNTESEACLDNAECLIDSPALQQLFELEKSSPGLIKRLTAKYEQHGSQLLQQIEGDCRLENADAIRQAAHSFKSASASFGADELTMHCKQIEQSPADFDAISQRMEHLNYLFEQTLVSLKQLHI